MEKKKKEIKLSDIFQIEKDIYGVIDKNTNTKVSIGILDEKIHFVGKYWLDELGAMITHEKNALDKIQNDLIMKYGKEENGIISVKMTEKNAEGQDIFTTEYVAIFNELNAIYSQSKTLEYYPIKLEFFKDLVTENSYKSLYQFFEN